MNKITFEDDSYIEFQKSTTPNKLFISLACKVDNKLSINSCEITFEQLEELIKSIK